jgi:RecA/RadA recombinase
MHSPPVRLSAEVASSLIANCEDRRRTTEMLISVLQYPYVVVDSGASSVIRWYTAEMKVEVLRRRLGWWR